MLVMVVISISMNRKIPILSLHHIGREMVVLYIMIHFLARFSDIVYRFEELCIEIMVTVIFRRQAYGLIGP